MTFQFGSWVRRIKAGLSGHRYGLAEKGPRRRRGRPQVESLEARVTPVATTFAPGAYIIDMGQSIQTVGNALKPYGLVYDMVTNYKVPVNWAIDPAKTTFRLDAPNSIPSDFTATTTTGPKSYAGGSFIIDAAFLTPAVIADINTWKAQGVVVDTLATSLTTEIYGQVTSFPRAVLDAQNGKLAVPYYANAGVPASSYQIGNPTDLDKCDDVYILPHADPATWTPEWQRALYDFVVNNAGGLWAGCHSVSEIENLLVPGRGQMNFLSSAGLVPFTVHAPSGSPPYTYNPAAANDPIMQIMNRLDAATQNGSEQIYVPNPSWRSTTTVAVYDPPAVDPGALNDPAVVAYGNAFGVATNGLVMYEGGHSLSGNGSANIAAQRAFFNFLLTEGLLKAPKPAVNFPPVVAGQNATITATISGGSGSYSYQWVSSNGGVFSKPTGTWSIGDPPITTQYLLTGAKDTVRLLVTDTCGRQGLYSTRVVDPPPVIDLDGDNSSGATGADYKGYFTGGGIVPAVDNTDTQVADNSTIIKSAEIKLTTRPDGGAETLLIDESLAKLYGINVASDGAGGFVLTGSATQAQYQEVIASLQYTNSLPFPTSTDRVITVKVNDGISDSNTAISRLSFLGGSVATVNKPLYLSDPGQGMDRIDPVAAGDTTTSSVPMVPVVSNNSTGLAVWTNDARKNLEYRPWNLTAFGTQGTTATDGSRYTTMNSAASPKRNEAIVIGVTDDRHVSGTIWNGTTWTPIAINIGGTTKQNLGHPSQKDWWGAAVAYETNSGRALLVWNTGTTLNYSIWNGTSWTAAASIPAYTAAGGVEPKQIRIASNPLAGSNEIVITVTDKNEVDRALVWNGNTSTWGNVIQLDNLGNHDFTDTNVVYEQQSGRAMVVYASGTGGAVGYRLWDGATWSAASTVAAPAGSNNYAQWTVAAGDPNSNRIVLGVQSNGKDAWMNVWNGSAWGTSQLGIQDGVDQNNNLNIAVAFESKSGEALAAYENDLAGTEMQFRTWNVSTGWSAGTNFGALANQDTRAITLSSNPYSDQVMLLVNDNNKVLRSDLWTGSSFVTPLTQLEANTGTTLGQPFSFIWDRYLPGVVTTTTTFTQTAPMALPFVVPAGAATTVTTYIQLTSGTLPAAPKLAVSLSQGGSNFATLPAPPTVTPLGGGLFKLDWTGTVPGNVVVPAGGQISLTLTDFDSTYSFNVFYDSNTFPSKVQIATATGISVDALDVFGASYPFGAPITTTPAGQTAFIRFTVSDPFGAADITSADVVIRNSSNAIVFTATVDDLNGLVDSTPGSKTYELEWPPPLGDTYTITVTAHEGTEGITSTRQTTITATAQPDLVVTKSDGGATVSAGGSVAYTINYTNAGLAVATGVVITEFLPVGATFNVALSTPGWVAIGAGAFQFTVGTVAPGLGGSVTFSVTVPSPVPATLEQLINTVQIADDGTHGADTNPNNNLAVADTPVFAAPDLVVTKTDGGISSRQGGTIVYLISYTNVGTQDAVGVVLTEVLPAFTTFDITHSVGDWDDLGDGQFSLTIGDLPVGASGVATFAVTVDSPLPPSVVSIFNAVLISDSSGTDQTPADNTDTETTPLSNDPRSDLSITKTDGVTTVRPGSVVTYTITVSNGGPVAVTGASFTDNVPALLSGVSFTTVVAGGATVTPASGSGNAITGLLDMPKNSTVTYTVTGTLDPNASGTLTNVAAIVPPDDNLDINTGDNVAFDQDDIVPESDLSLNKTFTFTDLDGSSSLTPGDRIVFALTVTNSGPNPARNVAVTDLLPSGYQYVGDDAAINGHIYSPGTGLWVLGATLGAIAPNNTAVLHITATVGASGDYTNVAEVERSDSFDPDSTPDNFVPTEDDHATVTPTVQPKSDLSLAKILALTSDLDGNGVLSIGDRVTFTLTLSNLGPDPAAGVHVADLLPAGYAFFSATATQGTYTAATGDWNIGTVGVLTTPTLSIVATVVGGRPVSAYTNYAQVSASGSFDPDSTAGDNSTTQDDDASVTPLIADVSLQKTAALAGDNDDSGSITVGDDVVFTLIVTNSGPDFATGVQVTDLLPAGFTYVGDDSPGAYNPVSGVWTVGVMAPGTTQTLNITATINAAGTSTNTAQVSASQHFDPDSTPNNNVPSEDDQSSVTVTTGATAQPPVAVNDSSLLNPPGPVTLNVTNNDSDPNLDLDVATVDLDPSAGAPGRQTTKVVPGQGVWTVDDLGNVTFTPEPGFTGDPTPIPYTVQDAGGRTSNSATITVTYVPRADLQITKTDGTPTAIPGAPNTYTIVVTNAGPRSVTGAKVTDVFPADFVGVTWTATSPNGATGFTPSGSGNINDTVTMPVGSTITYVVSGTILATATGLLSNTASVTPPVGVTDPNPGNNSATDTDILTPQANLAVSKTDGAPSAVPGTSTTYTIVVSNAGPSAVIGATVSDPMPAGVLIATWTATASSGGGSVTGPASGAGDLTTTVNLPVGASITFTYTVLVSSAATGNLVNTATISPPPGVTDPTPGNNSTTDTDTLTPRADLSITKSDGIAAAVPGSSTTYTLVVSNNGPSDVTGAAVLDTLPAGVTSATWTVSATSGGGAVTGPTTGTGTLATTVNLPVNATVTFTYTVQIDASATGTLTNTATITAPGGTTDPTPGNNTATDTDNLTPRADLSITKTDGVTSVVPGNTTTYTIVVSNAGPSTAVNQQVSDVFSSVITSVSWSAVASAGSSVAQASGTGNILTTVTLLPGGTVTFTALAQVSPLAQRSLVTLVNTATVAVPPGDTTPDNNTATDEDSLTPQVGLAVSKTDNQTTAVPGTSTTYTIVVSNAGPSSANGATVNDPLPAGVTSATWTVSATSGGAAVTGPTTGIDALITTVNLPPVSSVTFSFTVQIDPAATGDLVNTATITPAGGGAPASATDTDSLTPLADLSVTKTDNQTTAVPGTSTTYTIVVSNAGPSTVSRVLLTDTVPVELLNPVFGTPTAGSYNPATGIWSGLSLAAGQSVSITLTGDIDPAATGSLTNTARVAPPIGVDDPDLSDNNATDTDTLTPVADLSLTKTDGVLTAVPGTSTTYTLVVTNSGPSTVSRVLLTDTVPAGLLNPVYGTPSSGAYDPVTGLWTGLSLRAGQSISITLTGTIDPAATGVLTNRAHVAPPTGVDDPDPSDNDASDTDTLTPKADLAITKTDGVNSAAPGTATTYAIVVSNNGPSAVTGASILDALPAGAASATWTFVSATNGGAVAGPSAGSGALATTVDLPVGASITFTFTVQIDPSATGSLNNTATITAPAQVTDPTPGNNGATDVDTLTPQADLSITKTDGVLTVVPGTSTTYTIVVRNSGPSTAVNQAVTDLFPSAITAVTWTAVASAGSSVAQTTGSGNINTTVTLLPGGVVTFTAIAQVSPSARSQVVSLVNTATVAVPPGDATPGDNTATDVDALTPQVGLAIAKTDNQTTAVPGTPTTYTIVVSNAGPSTATGAALSDPLPAGAASASWTFTGASGGGTVTGPTAGSGPLATTVTLPPGASVIFTFTVAIDPAATSNLVNTATVTPSGGTPIGATDTDILTPRADLSLTKTDGVASVVPGTSTTYTLVVHNDGPSTVSSVTMTDTVPVGLLNPVFGTPSAGSYNPATGLWTGLSLAAGQSVSITLTGLVDPAATGVLTNSAHVAPPAGVTDPDPSDNTATDTDTLTPQADLSVAKTDGQSSAVPGTNTTYTITVTNSGPSTVSSVRLTDTVPAALLNPVFGPTSAGVYNPATGLWTGLTLATNQSVTITLTGTIDPAATGILTNTAQVAPPPGVTDPDPTNNTGADTDTLTPQADLAIVKTDGQTAAVPGTNTTYTLVVSNNGPSAVVGASVLDSLPAGVLAATWTVAAVSGGGSVSGPSSGIGALNTTVDLPAGGSVSFTFTVFVSPSATGVLINTATVTPPAGVTDPDTSDNASTDTDTLTPQADLAISKSDGILAAIPGMSTTYTIVVSNKGPSTAVNQAVTDFFPPAITAVSWTAVPSTGSSVAQSSGSGDINTTVTLLPGGTVTFTAVAQVDPAATGFLTNIARVAVPAGDTTPADNTATDVDGLVPVVDLVVIKDDGQTTATPGTSTTYTITVGNAGPSNVVGASVFDPLPPGVTAAVWTATGSSGGGSVTGPAAGIGALATTVDLPAGATVTFSFTVVIDPSATGSLVNTATITPVGGTPTGATDVDTLTPEADLSLVKDDGKTSAVPGTPNTYTITITNAGPSTVNSVTVTDVVPVALLSPVFTPSTGSYDPATGAWTGLNLAAGQSVTLTLTGVIDPAATGVLTNTATVRPPTGVTDPDPTDNSDGDTDTLTPQADLVLTKTDGVPSAVPGGSTTYTLLVTNTGPSAVVGASVTDPLPVGATGGTWAFAGATGGGSVTGPSGGSGALATTVDLPVGAIITFTYIVQIDPAATGSLINTATVTPPAGVTDPDPSDNTPTDTDTLTPQADLSIAKTDGQASAVPGTPVTYTIVVSNNGPSAVIGASVSDPLPTGATSATWTVSATSGGGSVTGPGNGVGGLAAVVNLPVGATITFTYTVQVSPSATGLLTNTATVTPPAGVTDPDPADNTVTDTDALTPQADLSITKTDGIDAAIPGMSTTYTLVVRNTGPSTAVDRLVQDRFPSAIIAANWTATASAGSSVAAAGGSGDIVTTVTLLPGGVVTFTVVAQISSTATGVLANTATVAVPPGDATPADNTATDVDALTPLTNLVLSKSDGQSTAVPGTSTTYTITVGNAGPSAATGVALSDPLPVGVIGATWAFAGASGGGTVSGPLGGSGALATTVDLPVGASITFTYTVQVDPTAVGSLTNTATATPPGGTPISAIDTDTLTPRADLSVAKDNGVPTVVPGTPTTYTITVSNAGPSTVSSVRLTDAVPAALLNPVFGTPSSGSYNPATGLWTGLTLAAGQSISITLTGNVDPAATGVLTNTATVSPPAGVTDPDPTDNSATDTDSMTPRADLSIIKNDTVSSAVPGGSTTYTITVSNTGPSAVVGASVSDALPAGATGGIWAFTAQTNGGSVTGPSGGSGALAATVNLPVNASVTFTFTVQIDPAATGSLTNTATVTPPAGVTDPDPGDNSSTDIDTLTPRADLSINKTDAVTSVVPGTATSYILVVSNNGPSAVTGATVSDLLPAGAAAATWTVIATSGGGSVTGPASGTGALNTTVDLPVNATVTFTFTVQISPSATGSLTNTATVTVPAGVTDSTPGDNTATDTDTLTPRADLSITKSDDVLAAVPGMSTTYTIVVRNAGPSTAVNQAVTDVFPTAITTVSWTATASSGSSVAQASGNDDINTTVTLLPGGVVTFIVVADIDPAASGLLTNTATVATPAGDATPGDNTATDTDALDPLVDLSLTKTDNQTTAVPGLTTTYTIVVSNAGPSTAAGAALSDPLPAGATAATWAFAGATGGGSVSGPLFGTDDLATTVNLPPGATVTFTFTVTIDPTATGSLVNTATVTPTVGTPANGADTDTLTPQADLSIFKTDDVTEAVPGTPTTYTITVHNAGPSTVSSVFLTDLVPPALLNAVFGAESAGSYDPGTGVWSGLNLAAGDSVTLTLTGDIDPSATGALTNTVHVAPSGGVTDPNGANDNASDTDTLTPRADLSLTKTDGVTEAVPGTSTIYTLVVRNDGPSDVVGAIVSDPLPAGASGGTWITAASGGGGAVTGPGSGVGALLTTVDLPSGGSVTFTFTVQISSSATGVLTNTATVTPPRGTTDPDPSDNNFTDTDTLTPRADLSIAKDDGQPSAVPGATTTYTITVSNAGPSAVTGASVFDALPAGVVAAGWTATTSSGGGSVTGPASGVGPLATTVDLPALASVTFTFTVQIDPAATGVLVNTATVTAPAGTTDPGSGNNSRSDTDTLTPQADLSITKTDNSLIVVPGSVTYTLVVRNAGPSAVFGATVNDPVPASASGATWSATASSGGGAVAGPSSGIGALLTTVNLPVGATITFTYTVQVSPSAIGPLTNTATVTPPAAVTDPSTGDNTATDTDFPQLADVAISKTVSNARPNLGDVITFTITVASTGDVATGVTITDVLPPGLVFVAASASQGTYDGVTWVVGTVSPAAPQMLLIQARVVSLGAKTNVAVISHIDQFDPNPGNNASSAAAVPTMADVSIQKVVNQAQVTYGLNVTFTLIVHNNGPDAATGVVVADPVPPGLALVSAVPSLGTYDAGTSLWTIGTLPSGSTVVLTMVAVVTAVGPIVNSAEVVALQFDPNLSNNASSALVTGTNPAPVSKDQFLVSTPPPPPTAPPPPPLPPADPLRANADFVNDLYRHVLGREADTGGLASWMNALQRGTSRLTVAQAVWGSAEHRGLQADQLYENILRRPADPAGRAIWANALMTGYTVSDVQAAFLASPEYANSHPGDAAFLAGLYQDLLGRLPDPAGLSSWLAVVGSGASRGAVVAAFQGSAEAMARVVDGYYRLYLGRAADPAGMQTYMSLLLASGPRQGESVAVSLLASDEFLNVGGPAPPLPAPGTLRANVLFVNALYQDTLGRNADASALTIWAGALAQGAPRSAVVHGVWGSAEHRGVQVDQLYLDFLHRPADAAGRATWGSALSAGATVADVEATFLASAEYQASHVSDAAFVAGLYQDVLGRVASAGEIGGWTTKLSQGLTRAATVSQFISSNEALARVIAEDYGTYLGRPPDPAGAASYLNMLLAGGPRIADEVAIALLSSDEYLQRAGTR